MRKIKKSTLKSNDSKVLSLRFLLIKIQRIRYVNLNKSKYRNNKKVNKRQRKKLNKEKSKNNKKIKLLPTRVVITFDCN